MTQRFPSHRNVAVKKTPGIQSISSQ